jgi:hypothetical protein
MTDISKLSTIPSVTPEMQIPVWDNKNRQPRRASLQQVTDMATAGAAASAAEAAASAAETAAAVPSVHVADYPALRAYSGAAQSALVTAPGIAGTFVRDATVTVDNGGTEIVGVHGWKRVFDGAVRPEWFGTYASGGDHSAIVQAAINTGRTVDLGGNTYNVANLTQSTNAQSIVSSQGIGRLIKNANGPILTASGDDFLMENINWRGDASVPTFTGDGVVATGERPAFINCGGRWISGVPLKATKNRVRVKGTCDIYQTTDATAAGFDILIGTSGTATLYHELDEVYSGQATGGIKLIDTGSHTIKGGQFGKLHIAAGTSPGGVNGGKTLGARILGVTTVELASAVFSGNQFGAVAITFAAGTSGCRLDTSNVFSAGATIVNNGNVNNFIAREVSGGSTPQIKYGPDTSSAIMTLNLGDATEQWQFSGSLVAPNTRGYRGKLAAGTAVNLAVVTSGDVGQLGSVSFARLDISGPFINFNTTAGTQVQMVDGELRPFSDNTKSLGTSALRWSNVYGANFRPGAGAATWTSGTGTPEGSVAAAVGSLYTRTDGGAGTTLYVKESGAGNTGWVAK